MTMSYLQQRIKLPTNLFALNVKKKKISCKANINYMTRDSIPNKDQRVNINVIIATLLALKK